MATVETKSDPTIVPSYCDECDRQTFHTFKRFTMCGCTQWICTDCGTITMTRDPGGYPKHAHLSLVR